MINVTKALVIKNTFITSTKNIQKDKNIKSLVLPNNRIKEIDSNLFKKFPYAEDLILTNNLLVKLDDLKNIFKMKKVINLVLIGNKVCEHKKYWEYIVNNMPWLQTLDYCRIKKKQNDVNLSGDVN